MAAISQSIGACGSIWLVKILAVTLLVAGFIYYMITQYNMSPEDLSFGDNMDQMWTTVKRVCI